MLFVCNQTSDINRCYPFITFFVNAFGDGTNFVTSIFCCMLGKKINREYLYDAYSERDHIPLAK